MQMFKRKNQLRKVKGSNLRFESSVSPEQSVELSSLDELLHKVDSAAVLKECVSLHKEV